MGALRLFIGMLLVAAVGAFILFVPVITHPIVAAITYTSLISIGLFGMVLCEDYIAMNKDL